MHDFAVTIEAREMVRVLDGDAGVQVAVGKDKNGALWIAVQNMRLETDSPARDMLQVSFEKAELAALKSCTGLDLRKLIEVEND